MILFEQLDAETRSYPDRMHIALVHRRFRDRVRQRRLRHLVVRDRSRLTALTKLLCESPELRQVVRGIDVSMYESGVFMGWMERWRIQQSDLAAFLLSVPDLVYLIIHTVDRFTLSSRLARALGSLRGLEHLTLDFCHLGDTRTFAAVIQSLPSDLPLRSLHLRDWDLRRERLAALKLPPVRYLLVSPVDERPHLPPLGQHALGGAVTVLDVPTFWLKVDLLQAVSGTLKALVIEWSIPRASLAVELPHLALLCIRHLPRSATLFRHIDTPLASIPLFRHLTAVVWLGLCLICTSEAEAQIVRTALASPGDIKLLLVSWRDLHGHRGIDIGPPLARIRALVPVEIEVEADRTEDKDTGPDWPALLTILEKSPRWRQDIRASEDCRELPLY